MKKTLLIYLMLIVFYGCYTPISLIVKNPQLFENQKVRIQGYVKGSTYLKDIKIIYVKDYNGKHTIPVITRNEVALVGEKVSLSGHVNPQFVYKSDTMLVIIQDGSKLKKRKIFGKKSKYRYISGKNFKPKDNPYILKD